MGMAYHPVTTLYIVLANMMLQKAIPDKKYRSLYKSVGAGCGGTCL
jgi:hypothetical protein